MACYWLVIVIFSLTPFNCYTWLNNFSTFFACWSISSHHLRLSLVYMQLVFKTNLHNLHLVNVIRNLVPNHVPTYVTDWHNGLAFTRYTFIREFKVTTWMSNWWNTISPKSFNVRRHLKCSNNYPHTRWILKIRHQFNMYMHSE